MKDKNSHKQSSFGMFIDDGRAYKVTTPFTPRQYINVMTSDDGYLAEISQWGTGSAFFQFPDGEINTITDADKKTLYCTDKAAGDVWCPGVYPMMSQVENFSCEHHQAYTEISSVRNNIRVKWRTLIPRRGASELWTVTVDNLGDSEREVSVVPAVRPLLMGFKAPRFFDEQVQYSVCDFKESINGIYFEAGNPNPVNKRYNLMLSSSEDISGYCGDGDIFLGAPLSMNYPQALISNKTLGRHMGLAGEPFASIENTLRLKPGEKKTLHFIMAVTEGLEEAEQVSRIIRLENGAEDLFRGTVNRVEELRDRLQIQTPSQELNWFVNNWMKKGLEYGLRKKDGNRDNLQFADGLTMSDPKRVRAELLRVFGWQYQDGHTLRSFVPLDTVEYCDGPLWLVITTCGYIKFTDDTEFLNADVPFYDGGSASVIEHLRRGMRRIDEGRGPHGLPLARFADWNDALNLKDPNAESVFMAMGYGLMLKEMSALMRYIGSEGEAEGYEKSFAEHKALVNAVAWDEEGGYYVRAFDYSDVIGGSKSQGPTIFINPQSWSILSGIVTDERLPAVLRAIDEKIETELGCPVNVPAFKRFDNKYGRISAQLPGTWENGSSYCHVTAFKTTADTLIGRGDNALNSLLKVFPGDDSNPLENSFAIPFALTSSFSTNRHIWGRAGRPWLTGTQAWAMRTAVEGLLGIRRAYGGFEIKPAFPSGWKEAECKIKRFDDEYRFIVKNTGGTSASQSFIVMLNGRILSNGFVPFQKQGIHEVEIIISES